MPRDDRALNASLEKSAAVLTTAGFPRMPARVLMALMGAEAGGLTAVDLASRLSVSAAAISGAVRYLQDIGIVHRIAQSGSRRDRYELPEDAWYTALITKNPVYETLATLADSAAAALGNRPSAEAARLANMARFYRFLSERMPLLIDEWEALRSEEAGVGTGVSRAR